MIEHVTFIQIRSFQNFSCNKNNKIFYITGASQNLHQLPGTESEMKMMDHATKGSQGQYNCKNNAVCMEQIWKRKGTYR